MKYVFLLLPLLALSLLGVAWASRFLGMIELGLLLWACGAVLASNLPLKRRYHQWVLPPLAVIWSLACLGLMVWIRAGYQELLIRHASLFDWLERVLGFQAPPDISGLVMLACAAFLALFVFAKGIYLSGMRFAIERQYIQNPFVELAYRHLPAQGWTLITWWLCARWLGWAVSAIGFVLIAVSWLLTEGYLQGSWVPLLAAALFLVGAEFSAWLGGPVGDEWKPTLDGEDNAAGRHGRFVAVWKAYRDTWPSKWLAAGNLSPRLPGQASGKKPRSQPPATQPAAQPAGK